ncbi:MAG: carboxypeptidase-like regulatory domain-containing protein [bacterium]|nr:carboxypeptidase-like regulatory domain-containing protein [bacterium]
MSRPLPPRSRFRPAWFRLSLLLLAPVLAGATGNPVRAEEAVRRDPGSLGAAGLHIAPRFLGPPGEIEVSFRGGGIAFPSTGGAVVGGQLGIQATVADDLVLLADLGPRGSLGLRGKWGAGRNWHLGWDVRARSDIHFQALPTRTGLSAPAFGLIPGFPGGAALGGEASLVGALEAGDFRLDLSPAVYALSNREGVGLRAALEWRSPPWELGAGTVADLDVNRPDRPEVVTPTWQMLHQVGVRHYWGDTFHVHGVIGYSPGDVYGTPSWSAMLGTGWRLLGRPLATESIDPGSPESPVSAAVPRPPARTRATPVYPVPRPGEPRSGLWGRVLNGLALGDTAWTELALKRRVKGTWVDVPWTYPTDAEGRFRIVDIPPGEYQVVFRGDRDHALAAGAAVSEPVRLEANRAVRVELDVGWDSTAIGATRKGTTVSVRWPAKPDVPGARYEVVVKAPGLERNVVSSGETTGLEVRFELPEAIARLPGLTYAVKYRSPDGAFLGGNRYGQTAFRPLETADSSRIPAR